jgi:L-ribulokinase
VALVNGFLIGLDYGTESARGVLLNSSNGTLCGEQVHPYRQGVMDGSPLPPEWALQDADDYLEAATVILSSLAKQIPNGGQVLGIGIDFTACTPLPTLADGTPLSRIFPEEPHAFVKLWKHHAAQAWADEINDSGADFLRFYGRKTSSEWMHAKAAQIASEAPEIWDQTARFIEAGDWLVWQLTGFEVRSACQAGYKAFYQHGQGYPNIMRSVGLESRLSEPVAIGSSAGALTQTWLERTGVPGTPVVAVATIDAHAAVPAVAVTGAGELVCILGTSACHMLLSHERLEVPGICGVVRDGIIPGMWGYEAGQAGFGDILSWFVRNNPRGSSESASFETYSSETYSSETYSFETYNTEAANIPPGSSGLIALDWWNGCRTPLVNAELSGVIVGLTLTSTPSEIYLALLESLAYGTRAVIETFEQAGADINKLVMTGGLAERNPLLMQLLADITNRELEVPNVRHASGRGAAMHAAVASDVVTDFAQAVERYGTREVRRYSPRPENRALYDELYGMYSRLSDSFAEGQVMQGLKRLRQRSV